MSLVDDKAHYGTPQQETFDGFGTEHLRSNIEDVGCSVGHLCAGRRPLDGVEKPVDGDGLADTSFHEVVHLIFHERLQGGQHHGEAMAVATGHEGGKLEGERLASTSGEDGED